MKVEPKDFSQLPSIKLPAVTLKKAFYGCVFRVLDGRYFFNEVYSSDRNYQLIVFDLHHNKIRHEYFYSPTEGSILYCGHFVPYDLHSGLIYYRNKFQTVQLDDENNTIKFIGSEIPIEGCSQIWCAQFLQLAGDPTILICYKTVNNLCAIRLYKWLKFEKGIAFMVYENANNQHMYHGVFPKQMDNYLYLMCAKSHLGLDQIELLRSDLQDKGNPIMLEKIETTLPEDWHNGLIPYATGVWRDQTFICCIHSSHRNDGAQTGIYCFELSTLKWSYIFLPHRGIVSMPLDVRYGSNDTLLFCSFNVEIKGDGLFHFIDFDSIHRFPVSKPEELFLLCIFEVIRRGFLDPRIETWDMLRNLNSEFRLLKQKENELKSVQEELEKLQRNIANFQRRAISSNNKDPTSKWAHLLDFKLPMESLFK